MALHGDHQGGRKGHSGSTMIKLKRMRYSEDDPLEFIFINPEQVTVIIPRSNTKCGPASDIGLANATTWAVQHEAEKLAHDVWCL